MSDNSPVSQPTRRQFMMRVAGAAAAIPLVPHLTNAAEAAPPPTLRRCQRATRAWPGRSGVRKRW